METIDAGDVPLEQVIGQLLRPTGLRRLIGHHGIACFALVRSTLAPEFFDRLIENVDTIDATTRNHVAFVVFHGKRFSLLRPDHNGNGRYYEHHIEGLSMSSGQIRLDKSDGDHELRFNDELTNAVRAAARGAPRASMVRASEFAVTHLIRHFQISEASLPCLAFVDGNEASRPIVVPLSRLSTVELLYSDVLVPLSDAFARLEYFWEQKRNISGHLLGKRQAIETVAG